LCKFICKLLTDSPRNYQDCCQCCGAYFLHLFQHIVCLCTITANIRANGGPTL
jgi:hypothetical protein